MACLKFVQNCWSSTIAKGASLVHLGSCLTQHLLSGHDGNVLSSLKLLAARPGYLKTSLPIEKRHLNNHKAMHGGVLLSLTDTVTSLALSTQGIPAPTGVSINISCEFVRPGGTESSELIGIGEVVQRGKTLAYTRVSFYTPEPESKLVAFGSHTKHMGKNVPVTKFSEDGETELGLESHDGRKDRAKL
ncbi:hypothetical protein EHS25_005115 [Saitozyma podzolica]|uniref:Thioesterase domain-containing protein n=1 Tax=Saitozyma podzolica TaxID=1890683 RepID=A0A427Y2G0_9TREE|nr:hypothetical protein EHS25_005115 [Saitozyma podzolica]